MRKYYGKGGIDSACPHDETKIVDSIHISYA